MTAQNPLMAHFAILTIFCACVLASSGAAADPRTDYLIKMLEKSDNYRLRVQAATTLGKLRIKDSVPSLVKATRDKNELVIVSAAIALKQIGDASVLSQLEASRRATTSAAAKSQLDVTIRVLKEIGSGGQSVPAVKPAPRYLVRIDAMGNSSSTRDAALTEEMRKIVWARVKNEADVIVQKGKMSEGDVRKALKRQSLKGYIMSGSILRLEVVDDQLYVKLGLNLFTNPDYNLLMMPTSEAAIRIDQNDGKNGLKKETIRHGLKIVADGLIDSIFATLRQSDKK